MKRDTPPTLCPDSSNVSPSSGGRPGRGGVNTFRTRARSTIIEHCLLGREEGTDEHGERVGVGLILRQIDDFVVAGTKPDDLLGAIAHVRTDEDAPPPDAAFSLRWFKARPERLTRCIGEYHKAAAPSVSAPWRALVKHIKPLVVGGGVLFLRRASRESIDQGGEEATP